MNSPHRPFVVTLLFSAAAASLSLSGCGGATAATSVTYRPSRPDSVPAEAAVEAAADETDVSATSGGFGSLKGRIVYGGTFSPLPPLYAKGNASKDNEVCGLEAAPNEAVVVNNGGLANVFIWLDKVPKGVEIPPSQNDPVVFDQKYCVFKPHALVMRTGQTVRVLNSDPVLHNTHTKPERNNEFNQGIEGNSETPLVYNRPEKRPLAVVCDIHPWMIAYHLPLDHPFAAVSGPDGTFEIPQIPSGKLELKLWHETGKELERAYKVDIKPGETTTVEITVPASKVSP
jgi:plastocyanin